MDELKRNANGQGKEPTQEHPFFQPAFCDFSSHFRLPPKTSEKYARIDNIHFLNFTQPPASNQFNFGGTNGNLNFDGNNQTKSGDANLNSNQMNIAHLNFAGNYPMNVANVNFDRNNQFPSNPNLNYNDQMNNQIGSTEDKNQTNSENANTDGNNQMNNENVNYEENNQANGNQSNVGRFKINPASLMSGLTFGFNQPMSFCPMPFSPIDVQYNKPKPTLPMGSQFNMAPWGGVHKQMLSVPPGYIVGPPPELMQYEHLSRPMNHLSRGWNKFDAPNSQQRGESLAADFSKGDGDGRTQAWETSRFRPQYPGRGCYEGSIQHMSPDERFKVQLTRFPTLPIEIHRRVGHMPAYEIVANFEVNLVRLRANCIIATNACHAIFTKKPDTEQCWLMAIALTEDTRTYIKFNRLLTCHVRVRLNGAKAVELTASKVGPENEEVYVFNFSLEEDTTNFIEVLDKGRNQVWINPPPPLPPQNFVTEEQYYHSQYFPNEQKLQKLLSNHENALSDRRPYRDRRNCKGVDSALFLNSLKGKLSPELEGVEQERSRTADSGKQINTYDYGNLKFVKYKATADIFNKRGSEYVLLASGEMNIVSHDDSFDEVVFVRSEKVIFHHAIYQWHKLRFEKHENVYVCKWIAPIYLIGSKNLFPATRELKLELKTEAAVSGFYVTFQEAIEKAAGISNVPVV